MAEPKIKPTDVTLSASLIAPDGRAPSHPASLLSPQYQSDPRPSTRSLLLEFYHGEDCDHDVEVALADGDRPTATR